MPGQSPFLKEHDSKPAEERPHELEEPLHLEEDPVYQAS